jgi:hypothetical protein
MLFAADKRCLPAAAGAITTGRPLPQNPPHRDRLIKTLEGLLAQGGIMEATHREMSGPRIDDHRTRISESV